MGPRRLRDTALTYVMVVGLCCSLLTSCGDTNRIVEPEPPDSLSDLFGPVLFRADGSSVGTETIEDKAVVAIYFAARACPACEAFTPMLISFYDQLREDERSFEVVLVSLEASAQAMFAYMTDYAMPWLAVPFDSDEATALPQRYGVRWIPTLIVVDGEGKTISINGVDDIYGLGDGAYNAWLARSGGQ